jgi:hypothetical protein
MDYCRKASTIDSIRELPGLSEEAYALADCIGVEEIILGIRSDLLMKNLPNLIIPTENKCDLQRDWSEYIDVLQDLKEVLFLNGFIRADIEDDAVPERYFVEKYALPCGLVDRELCCPYDYSNIVYEQYGFRYDRLEKILNVLEDEFNEEQYEVVRADIMYMEPYGILGDSQIIADVMRHLLKHNERLKSAFSSCWKYKGVKNIEKLGVYQW